MATIQRSIAEIDAVLNQAAKAVDTGRSKYPGMSYEQGIDDMYRWLTDRNQEPLFDGDDDDAEN